MNDLISRQDAIDAMATWDLQEMYLPIHFKQLLEDLPSAQQWIPCSERMPEPSEDGKSFLVTVSEMRSYNTNGEFYKKEDRRVAIELFVFKDGNGWFVQSWYDKAKIIAWMPLAEPFNEGKMETEKLSRCPKCGEYTSVKSGVCEYCGERMVERREDGEVL